MNIWDELPQPFFVLAPMDDVTDTVFRQIVASCASPDLYFTEFVNVDGLQSPGRPRLLPKLQFTDTEQPIIAQIWGKNPENYYKTAQDLVKMGYKGIDINMGCPVKAVVKDGCCVALINNRELAAEIIQATREGAHSLPVSVKTRLGFNEIDLSWHELLLKQKLNALSIHGRTRSQMSKVPANWAAIEEIRKLRDKLSPTTKIVGNGDVMTRDQGLALVQKHQLDGIMVGRGVFDDPFVFAAKSPWQNYSREQKIALYRRHVELFQKTYEQNASRTYVDESQGSNEQRTSRTGEYGERAAEEADAANRHKHQRISGSASKQAGAIRSPKTLNKFCKIYISSFDGAKELREQLMNAASTAELLELLAS